MIHLHSTQPQTIELNDDNDGDEVVEVAALTRRSGRTETVATVSRGNGLICDEIEVIEPHLGQSSHHPTMLQQQPVIDLLESDGSDDDVDDGEAVQVIGSNGAIENNSRKRQRYR